MKKAVITSDIIQSSAMSSEQRSWLVEQIEHKLKTLNKSATIESEMYRGDSFQCLVNAPAHALKLALLLKTYIRSLGSVKDKTILVAKQKENTRIMDVRMSLALGEVESGTGKMGTSNGEAFQLSGRKLDEMKRLKQSFSMSSHDAYAEELATEAVLLHFILIKTTALQCQVLHLKLEGWTEMEIARKLDIRQSAVNQRATSGGWHAIEAVVKRFENIYGNG